MFRVKANRGAGYVVRAYRVPQDDGLPNVVRRAGLAGVDWRTVYAADYNRALRRARPDPRDVKRGDVVHLPLCGPRVLKELFVELSRFRIQVERARRDLLALRLCIAETDRPRAEGEPRQRHEAQRREATRRLEGRMAALVGICRAIAAVFDSAGARSAHCGDLGPLAAQKGREAEQLQADIAFRRCAGAGRRIAIDRAMAVLNRLRAALAEHERFVKGQMSAFQVGRR